MLGIGILAIWFTKLRLAILLLSYFLYPPVMAVTIATKRHESFARSRPWLWQLTWIGLVWIVIVWPFAIVIPAIQSHFSWMPVFQVLVITPAILVSLVVWLVVPLPRWDRTHS